MQWNQPEGVAQVNGTCEHTIKHSNVMVSL